MKNFIKPVCSHDNNPDNDHRTATWYELFYDLIFVVAIASTTGLLDHTITWHHLFSFAIIFSALWWRWFVTALYSDRFDTGDGLHLTVYAFQMLCIATIAVLLPFKTAMQIRVFTLAYVFMLVSMWLMYFRAYCTIPHKRALLKKIISHIGLSIIIWVMSLFWVKHALYFWAIAIIAEASIPFSLKKNLLKTKIALSIHHLTERFGLFTLIVFGETINAMAQGLKITLNSNTLKFDLSLWPTLVIITTGFIILFSMCRCYFYNPKHSHLHDANQLTKWEYLHWPLLIAITLFSVGLYHGFNHQAQLSPLMAILTTIATAVSFALIAMISQHNETRRLKYYIIPLATLVLIPLNHWLSTAVFFSLLALLSLSHMVITAKNTDS